MKLTNIGASSVFAAAIGIAFTASPQAIIAQSGPVILTMRKSLIIFAISAVSVLVASVGLAAAQATAFDASVTDQIQRSVGCPDEAYLCGDADIDGFGPAEFRWYLVSFEPISQSCGEYTAIVTLTLGDGSTLTLDEAGTDCSPGDSFSSYPRHSYGQPQTAGGKWLVQDGTGVFAGLTGGGVNTVRIVGARLVAMYIGTLGA